MCSQRLLLVGNDSNADFENTIVTFSVFNSFTFSPKVIPAGACLPELPFYGDKNPIKHNNERRKNNEKKK